MKRLNFYKDVKNLWDLKLIRLKIFFVKYNKLKDLTDI